MLFECSITVCKYDNLISTKLGKIVFENEDRLR